MSICSYLCGMFIRACINISVCRDLHVHVYKSGHLCMHVTHALMRHWCVIMVATYVHYIFMQLHMCGHLCVSIYSDCMCAYVSICGLCVTVSVTGYLYAFVIMCNRECLMGMCIILCMDLGVDMHSVIHFHGDYLPHHKIESLTP